jgi:hypothetical protein
VAAGSSYEQLLQGVPSTATPMEAIFCNTKSSIRLQHGFLWPVVAGLATNRTSLDIFFCLLFLEYVYSIRFAICFGYFFSFIVKCTYKASI